MSEAKFNYIMTEEELSTSIYFLSNTSIIIKQFNNSLNSTNYNGSQSFTDPDFNDPIIIFEIIILSLIIIFTIAGNLLVIVAIVPSRTLRNPTHSLIANLAVADFLIGLTVLPLSATKEIYDGRWLFGQFLCSVWKTFDVLWCTASILSLCGISVDRYIGVSRPLAYSRVLTKTRVRLLMASIWALAIAISVAGIGWRDKEDNGYCEVNTELGYVIFSAIGSFYLPTLVILILYFLVYRAAIKYSKFLSSGTRTTRGDVTLRVHMGSSSRANSCARTSICDASNSLHKLSSSGCDSTATLLLTPNGVADATIDGSNHPFSHIQQHQLQQQRNSLAVPITEYPSRSGSTSPDTWSMSDLQQTGRRLTAAGVCGRAAKFKRQKRAAKTLGIVVGGFLVCWFPFFLLLPIVATRESNHREDIAPEKFIPFELAFWLGYFNSCINPIIYACSSRELRHAFRSILCRRCNRRRFRMPTMTASARKHAPIEASSTIYSGHHLCIQQAKYIGEHSRPSAVSISL